PPSGQFQAPHVRSRRLRPARATCRARGWFRWRNPRYAMAPPKYTSSWYWVKAGSGRRAVCDMQNKSPPGKGWDTGRCPTIGKMTVTLLTSQSAPATTNADALVTGVFQGQGGPVLAPITDEIDLMAALTALGATGKAEEITKIPTSGLTGGSARGA